MEILPKEPTVKAGTDTFTGDVWFDVVARGEEPSRVPSTSSVSRQVPGMPGMRMPSARRSM